MQQCVDCALPSVGERCEDCAVEVAETPNWRRPEHREPRRKRGGRRPGPVRICSVDGCETRSRRLIGYCEKHYYRWQRHGDPLKLGRASNEARCSRACPQCTAEFLPYDSRLVYCSKGCSYAAQSARWAQEQPKTCIIDGCSNLRRRGIAYCGPCERIKWPSDPQKRRATWRAKNHRRRAGRRQTAGQFDQVTPQYERQLREKARRCPLCSVRLVNEPYQHASKELDHMIPLNVGGTHTTGNVRIICRLCNLRRPTDGSDYTGPVTLWATA